MRCFLPLLPTICFLLSITIAQFIYPKPLNGSLADYTSGSVVSALNFSAGDDLLGSWSTPVGLSSFLLLRCTHTPSSTPIYPTNSSFNSTIGYVSPLDATWLQMPLFSNGDLGNGFNSGSNIFYAPDFFQGNDTTGQMCWFELYPGHNTQSSSDPAVDGEDSLTNTATVNGNGKWYFASEPFVVKQARPSGQEVTWMDDGTERGKPTRKLTGGSNTTDSGGNVTGSGSAGGTESTTSASASSTKNAGGRVEMAYGAGLRWSSWIGCIGWAVCISGSGGLAYVP